MILIETLASNPVNIYDGIVKAYYSGKLIIKNGKKL